MRERLVELIGAKICEDYSPTCNEWQPYSCEKCYANNCRIGDLADYLLENGVVEVRHGKWKEDAFLKPDGLVKRYPSVKCSECEIVFCDIINNHNYMYRYCPHCGAKMDKGEEENAEIIYSK